MSGLLDKCTGKAELGIQQLLTVTDLFELKEPAPPLLGASPEPMNIRKLTLPNQSFVPCIYMSHTFRSERTHSFVVNYNESWESGKRKALRYEYQFLKKTLGDDASLKKIQRLPKDRFIWMFVALCRRLIERGYAVKMSQNSIQRKTILLKTGILGKCYRTYKGALIKKGTRPKSDASFDIEQLKKVIKDEMTDIITIIDSATKPADLEKYCQDAAEEIDEAKTRSTVFYRNTDPSCEARRELTTTSGLRANP